MALRKFPMYIVDAFTKKALSGNQAAICLVPSDVTLQEDEMVKIGAEMNLSETAYIQLLDKESDFESGSKFSLRWFTPTNEVNLCGHATLASAAVLIDGVGNSNKVIQFSTKSGTLSVSRHPDKTGFLTMDFPKNEPKPQDTEILEKLLLSLVGDRDMIQEVQYSATTKKLVVRFKDHIHRKELERLSPKPSILMEAEPSGLVMGVGVTLKGCHANGCVDDEGNVYDFVSRYWAPWNGIPEDPVTGSWHTVIGPYWAKELDKTMLYARQCSPRGGDILVEVKDTRVTLMGQSVINLKGTFQL